MRSPTPDAAAREYAETWGRRAAQLEPLRLQALRALTETAAAQRFALLTQGGVRLPLRTTSGLVEQQRIFARLRTAP